MFFTLELYIYSIFAQVKIMGVRYFSFIKVLTWSPCVPTGAQCNFSTLAHNIWHPSVHHRPRTQRLDLSRTFTLLGKIKFRQLVVLLKKVARCLKRCQVVVVGLIVLCKKGEKWPCRILNDAQMHYQTNRISQIRLLLFCFVCALFLIFDR